MCVMLSRVRVAFYFVCVPRVVCACAWRGVWTVWSEVTPRTSTGSRAARLRRALGSGSISRLGRAVSVSGLGSRARRAARGLASREIPSECAPEAPGQPQGQGPGPRCSLTLSFFKIEKREYYCNISQITHFTVRFYHKSIHGFPTP